MSQSLQPQSGPNAFTGAPNFAQLVLALQEIGRASYLTQQTLSGLVAALGTPARYTVAGLPAVTTANTGQVAYATNGRNSGEGSGSGTGCLVTCNNAGIWAAVWSGTAPLA